MIASINQKIDLRTAVLFALPDKPRGFLRQNTQDAEFPFDLGNVILADLLKGETGPGVLCRTAVGMAPEMLIPAVIVPKKPEIEPCVIIAQLIKGLSSLFPEEGIRADKVTVNEIRQHFAQSSVFRDSGFFRDFGAGQAHSLCRQGFHNPDIFLTVAEQRTVEVIEFIPELRAFPEKQTVDVFVQALFAGQKAEIKGNTAENHVALRNVISGPLDSPGGEVSFRFAQGERAQENAAGLAIEQPPLVLGNVLNHPGGRGATDDENQIVHRAAVIIPEMLKRGQKTGLRRIQPGELVKEDHVLFVRRKVRQILPQHAKGGNPVGRSFNRALQMGGQLLRKITQLNFTGRLPGAGHLEVESSVEELVDQKGLSDPSATVENYQLGIGFIQTPVQPADFFGPGNDAIL